MQQAQQGDRAGRTLQRDGRVDQAGHRELQLQGGQGGRDEWGGEAEASRAKQQRQASARPLFALPHKSFQPRRFKHVSHIETHDDGEEAGEGSSSGVALPTRAPQSVALTQPPLTMMEKKKAKAKLVWLRTQAQ